MKKEAKDEVKSSTKDNLEKVAASKVEKMFSCHLWETRLIGSVLLHAVNR